MLGEKYSSSPNAAGVTSLVNGLGSIGGIVEGPIIGILSHILGWSQVMGLMILLTFVSTLATLKAHILVRKEDKKRKAMIAKESEENKSLLSV